MRLLARAPATAANLGPGFDCFALALDLCNEVLIDTDAAPGVSWEGEGAEELPTDGTDLVSRAMRSVAADADEAFEPFHLHGVNRIPLESGLGSSAAAAVAGVALARAWLRLPDEPDQRGRIFEAAARLEGHPDNAAAAAYGGLTIVADDHVRRIDVASDIRPVVLVPPMRLSTGRARAALPQEVPRSDAVFNVAHGALVVHAFATGDLDLLRLGLHDRLHQAVRLALVPVVREVFERLARAFPVCVSGAGPSLVAFPPPEATLPDPGEGWRVVQIPVRAGGIEILEPSGSERPSTMH